MGTCSTTKNKNSSKMNLNDNRYSQKNSNKSINQTRLSKSLNKTKSNKSEISKKIKSSFKDFPDDDHQIEINFLFPNQDLFQNLYFDLRLNVSYNVYIKEFFDVEEYGNYLETLSKYDKKKFNFILLIILDDFAEILQKFNILRESHNIKKIIIYKDALDAEEIENFSRDIKNKISLIDDFNDNIVMKTIEVIQIFKCFFQRVNSDFLSNFSSIKTLNNVLTIGNSYEDFLFYEIIFLLSKNEKLNEKQSRLEFLYYFREKVNKIIENEVSFFDSSKRSNLIDENDDEKNDKTKKKDKEIDIELKKKLILDEIYYNLFYFDNNLIKENSKLNNIEKRKEEKTSEKFCLNINEENFDELNLKKNNDIKLSDIFIQEKKIFQKKEFLNKNIPFSPIKYNNLFKKSSNFNKENNFKNTNFENKIIDNYNINKNKELNNNNLREPIDLRNQKRFSESLEKANTNLKDLININLNNFVNNSSKLTNFKESKISINKNSEDLINQADRLQTSNSHTKLTNLITQKFESENSEDLILINKHLKNKDFEIKNENIPSEDEEIEHMVKSKNIQILNENLKTNHLKSFSQYNKNENDKKINGDFNINLNICSKSINNIDSYEYSNDISTKTYKQNLNREFLEIKKNVDIRYDNSSSNCNINMLSDMLKEEKKNFHLNVVKNNKPHINSNNNNLFEEYSDKVNYTSQLNSNYQNKINEFFNQKKVKKSFLDTTRNKRLLSIRQSISPFFLNIHSEFRNSSFINSQYLEHLKNSLILERDPIFDNNIKAQNSKEFYHSSYFLNYKPNFIEIQKIKNYFLNENKMIILPEKIDPFINYYFYRDQIDKEKLYDFSKEDSNLNDVFFPKYENIIDLYLHNNYFCSFVNHNICKFSSLKKVNNYIEEKLKFYYEENQLARFSKDSHKNIITTPSTLSLQNYFQDKIRNKQINLFEISKNIKFDSFKKNEELSLIENFNNINKNHYKKNKTNVNCNSDFYNKEKNSNKTLSKLELKLKKEKISIDYYKVYKLRFFIKEILKDFKKGTQISKIKEGKFQEEAKNNNYNNNKGNIFKDSSRFYSNPNFNLDSISNENFHLFSNKNSSFNENRLLFPDLLFRGVIAEKEVLNILYQFIDKPILTRGLMALYENYYFVLYMLNHQLNKKQLYNEYIDYDLFLINQKRFKNEILKNLQHQNYFEFDIYKHIKINQKGDQELKKEPDIKIIFIFEIPRNLKIISECLLKVNHFEGFENMPDEYLVNINSIFKIQSIDNKGEYYEIRCIFTDEKEFINYNKNFISNDDYENSKLNNFQENYLKSMDEIMNNRYDIDDYYLSKTLLKLHKFDQAIYVLENINIENYDYDHIYYKMELQKQILLGLIYDEKGDSTSALAHHSKALKINMDLFKISDKNTAECLNNIGNTYENLGEYEKSLNYFKKSLSIYKILNDETLSIQKVCCYISIGNIYNILKEYEKSLDYLNNGLMICREYFGELHYITASVYNSLGLTFFSKSEFEQARKNFEYSLKIYKILYNDDNSFTASLYINLGNLYDDMNELEYAEENYNKGLNIFLNIYGKNHIDTAGAYNNLGVINLKKKKYSDALDNFKISYDYFIRVYGNNHPFTNQIFQNRELASRKNHHPVK